MIGSVTAVALLIDRSRISLRLQQRSQRVLYVVNCAAIITATYLISSTAAAAVAASLDWTSRSVRRKMSKYLHDDARRLQCKPTLADDVGGDRGLALLFLLTLLYLEMSHDHRRLLQLLPVYPFAVASPIVAYLSAKDDRHGLWLYISVG